MATMGIHSPIFRSEVYCATRDLFENVLKLPYYNMSSYISTGSKSRGLCLSYNALCLSKFSTLAKWPRLG